MSASANCRTGYHAVCSGWSGHGLPCDCACHMQRAVAERSARIFARAPGVRRHLNGRRPS